VNRTRSQARKHRVKRGNRNATKHVQKRRNASKRIKAKQVAQLENDVIQRVWQLEWWVHESDPEVGQRAFQSLSGLLHQLLTWLELTARLPLVALGALSYRMPQHDAWAAYQRGEHGAAWAGVELARLYRRIKTHLASQSRKSRKSRKPVNPLRDLLYGSKNAGFDMPPNNWFREEYASKGDYRPTGKMAVWIAHKVEEIRRLKTLRSIWRPYPSTKIAKDSTQPRPQSEAERVLAALSPPKIVQGDLACQRLDSLPPFGHPDAKAFKAWRSFVRRQVLTQNQVITELETLFPNQRTNVDGVITATLRSIWQAAQGGGSIILPEDW
jgi:hypothetical protein